MMLQKFLKLLLISFFYQRHFSKPFFPFFLSGQSSPPVLSWHWWYVVMAVAVAIALAVLMAVYMAKLRRKETRFG